MDVRVAYTYINKCIWCNKSGPWISLEIDESPMLLHVVDFVNIPIQLDSTFVAKRKEKGPNFGPDLNRPPGPPYRP